MYSELQESQARAVASLKAEKAECARLACSEEWSCHFLGGSQHLNSLLNLDVCHGIEAERHLGQVEHAWRTNGPSPSKGSI
eukprot:1382032-Amphidinium_carterae.1